MFKQLLFLGALTFSLTTSVAQIGINTSYRWNDASDWAERNEGNTQDLELLADGLSAGVDYWFRLENLRIEFLPELNYSRFEKTFADDREINSRFLGLFFNVNFYLFDLFNDCDCPTFSKQSNLLQKGFYLQLSPGVSYLFNQGKTINTELQLYNFENSSFAFSLGAGAGIDLGVSDLITLTPNVGIRYFPNAEWDNLGEFTRNIPSAEIISETTSIFQYHAGLRLGFRFDQ
jgi:hypothetical protein